eukprot:TRINITY_DN785_c0_g1_i1.p1 TRINITY_DN785_c0_g1~~TRINITY_DN785_c0_g1_i1.p1  ORF type:complete len:881 (-),score=338.00 TRINITY_DN785_c0_g1_i1:265-2871(-)
MKDLIWFTVALAVAAHHVAADRASFDCPMRELAVSFAGSIQPNLGVAKLQQVADALNGCPEKTPNCTVTVPTGAEERPRFGVFPLPDATDSASVYYVDAVHGSDSNTGTLQSPFRTIARSVQATRATPGTNTVVLRAGTFYLESGITLGPADSGLTFQAYPGEEAWISGAVPLTGISWKVATPGQDVVKQQWNCVYGGYGTNTGKVANWTACQQRCNASSACTTWTWHDANQGSYALQCWLRTDGICADVSQSGHVSGWHTPTVYVADVSSYNLETIKGLRVNGLRGIRARYPNADPELGFGSSLEATSWTAPNGPFNPDQVFRPPVPFRNSSASFEYYNLGVGGPWCSGPLAFDPPAGYWCSNMTEGGGAFTYRTPLGMVADRHVLPNQPYKNATGAVIQAWHPSHWASRMYLVGPGGYSFSNILDRGTFEFIKGGFQDARGSNNAGEFYIENVFEELDWFNEWYYDESTQLLYFAFNGTGTPPSDGSVAAVPDLQVLFNISGSQQAQIHDVSFLGIGFRDSAYSYFEAHTIPSGGDWALARTGSILAEGTVGLNMSGCVFERLDNHAVTLSGFNREAAIVNNEFVWLGESAIVLWGKTDGSPVPTFGFDATAGNQPRYSTIQGNFAHELGIWEKQSSFLFHGKSCLNTIADNIFFNGPRAGINFNDGLGGGSNLTSNLLFNTCRESGDHGPFNSWDRKVYETEWGVVKLYDTISHNFMISNYNGQEAVDNDDGSAYYETHHNLLVYSGNGMKNDYGGHDNHHHDNVYAFVGQGFGICSQLDGHEDFFYSNTVVQTRDGNYANGACSDPGMTVVYNNTVYSPTGAITECGMSLKQWQAKGNDPGTVAIAGYPTDEQLIAWSRAVLGL